MLEIVEKRINLNHSTSKSYNDQKRIKGEIINANDYVFAYNPRVTHTKFPPKKNGLHVVKEINDHLNLINANKCQQIQEKTEKWLHRDRRMFEQTWTSFKRT